MRFEREGWFTKDRFQLVRDELTVGQGGPIADGVKLRMPEAAYFFFIVHQRNRGGALKEVEGLLHRLNADWAGRIGEYVNEAKGALEGNIRYFKLELGQSLLSGSNPIVEPYFSELPNA